ncbi:MAG TPA: aspartate-semialdehyde dehydrogenase [Ktedonobacterales bacterium]
MSESKRVSAAVLGATGLVGQRLVALLADHPWFELVGVAGSPRHAGRPYGEAVRWVIEGEVPREASALPLVAATPEALGGVQIVFSALPAAAASQIEPAFARAGALVFSNASAHRMEPDVPLIVPEINPDHLDAIAIQRARRDWPGAIVANPNCSTIGLTLALAPLAPFGLRRAIVTTLQAASGAGYPGVSSLDLVDNVVPYIAGEEPKIETETRKILGAWGPEGFADAPLRLSAHCTRVGVREGHLECVSVELERPADERELIAAWRDFTAEPQRLRLPSAPAHPVVYRDEPDRPQPLRDRTTGSGMAVTVGRLRPCPVLDVKFVCLSHNTIRGAAGAALLNAELAYARGLLAEPRRAGG